MSRILIDEATMAARLSITERCLRDWRTRKIVPFYKVGKTVRFNPDAVFDALERYERKEVQA